MEGRQEVQDVHRDSIPRSNEIKGESPAGQEYPSRSKKRSLVGRKDPSVSGRADEEYRRGMAWRRKFKQEKEEVEEKQEIEDIHAATQRLLRETKGLRFPQSTPKPVSLLLPILERIRQRKLQRSQSSSTGRPSARPSSPNSKARYRLEELYPNVNIIVKNCPIQPGLIRQILAKNRRKHPAALVQPEFEEPFVSIDGGAEGLHADLQLKAVTKSEENTSPVDDKRMNLHMDSKTYDSSYSEEYYETDNKCLNAQELLRTVPHVRNFVDDEAEDYSFHEDKDDDTAEESHDVITQDTDEPADFRCQSEVHNKWLEQQDLAVEDALLHRLPNGWKSKEHTQAFPSDDREILLSRPRVRKLHNDIDGIVEPSGPFSHEGFSDQGKDAGVCEVAILDEKRFINACTVKDEDLNISKSDDEELKANLLYLLRKSENKTKKLSVTDDESSREILGLINKVNATTRKPRPTTAHAEVCTGTAGYINPHLPYQSQPSFIRNKVTTTKQGLGKFHSYVFCQDDSNTKNPFLLGDKKEQIRKEKLRRSRAQERASVASQQRASLASLQSLVSTRIQKRSSSPVKEVKPGELSLFQVLKQQAAELAGSKNLEGPDGRNFKADDLSIFSTMRLAKQKKGYLRRPHVRGN